ncbi:MAG TPA: glycosyltransferase family 4 protein [Vicinamibacterales bacterium]|nr:glycosyltransferase family 4 protein [Vicinamibacterales bacterium]
MSTIIVATASPPFAEGGHLVMARELVRALEECGHQATLLVTPQNRFGRQGSAYLATYLTDAQIAHEGRKVDQVISLRYPAYAVQHDNHVVWLNHRMREYYDLWDQFSAQLSFRASIKERGRRAIIHRVDRHLLTKRVRRLFVISATVQSRLQKWGGLRSEVLYPPPPARGYRNDGYGDYLFAVSRLTALKRFDLVLRALAEPLASGIRCVIAGEGGELESLVRLRRQLDLDDRVDFIGRIDDATLVKHLATCRAVVFPPFNEDYGFVTAEAFSAGKAVLTCRDSGGPAELVRDGVNGYVTDPTAESLARAMRTVMTDRNLAVQLGEAGHAAALQMTWPAAIEKLLI